MTLKPGRRKSPNIVRVQYNHLVLSAFQVREVIYIKIEMLLNKTLMGRHWPTNIKVIPTTTSLKPKLSLKCLF